MTETNKTPENPTQDPNKQRRRRRKRPSSERTPHQAQGASSAPEKRHGASSSQRTHHPRHVGKKRDSSYSKPAVRAVNKSERTQNEVTELLLPSASALQEFEYAVEGGAERMLLIAKAEQEHRHNWENHALKSQVKSQRIGLLFGLVISLSTLLLIKLFADAGKDVLAGTLAMSVFGAMALALFVAQVFTPKKAFKKR